MIKTIKKDGYNLHLIKSKGFNTVVVNTIFWNKLEKDMSITKRNFLIDCLLFSSLKYNTGRLNCIRMEELYGANVSGSTYRRGNGLFSEIVLSTVSDKYSEKGNVRESIKYYFDLLKKPNVLNGEFDLDSFEITKESLKNSINKQIENPDYIAIKEYRNLLGNDIYKFPIYGTIEDLNEITRSNLFDYYKQFINDNNIDIFVLGDISYSEIENIFDEFCFLKGKRYNFDDFKISYEKELTSDVIKSKYNQSKLILGGSLKDFSDDEILAAGNIFNIIYGSSPNSKLFLNVREKHSYAYSISSSISRLDRVFVIYSGISKENYEDCKKLILKELDEMREGNFSLDDINDAKEIIYRILNEIDDYQANIINHNFSKMYLNNKEKEKQIEEIRKVSKDDIISFAKKIKIDTILLFEEADNEED